MDIFKYISLTRECDERAMMNTATAVFMFKNSDSLELEDQPYQKRQHMGLNSSIFEFAKRAFGSIDYSVEMYPIYSNNIYPEIIMEDSRAHIIWDLNFWSLCENYIKYIYFLFEYESDGYGQTITEQYTQGNPDFSGGGFVVISINPGISFLFLLFFI